MPVPESETVKQGDIAIDTRREPHPRRAVTTGWEFVAGRGGKCPRPRRRPTFGPVGDTAEAGGKGTARDARCRGLEWPPDLGQGVRGT